MSLVEHHGECGIVDILRRQSKVHHFAWQRAVHGVKAFLDKILHSLYIVVGGLLYLFDTLCRFEAPFLVYGAKRGLFGKGAIVAT